VASAISRETELARVQAPSPDEGRAAGLHGLAPGIWVLLLTVAGGLLRAFAIGSNSFWVDEFATFKIATLPFPEIQRAAAEVNFCPPLFFWLVHGVVTILGSSEASLRLVSAAAGTLTIPVIWLLTREVTGSRAIATLSAALLAVNPLHIWYSQEARAYALMVWLGCTALLCLAVATRTRRLAPWAGFVAAMAAALLTHTTGPILLLVAWAWVLLSPRRTTLLKPLVIATAIIGLILAPFALEIAGAVAQAESTHSPARPLTGLEIPYTLLTYVTGYSFGPSTREIQNLGPASAIALHPLETMLGGAVTAVLLYLMLFRRVHGRRHFLILFLVPTVAMLLGSATSGKAYQARYALAGLVGFCGLAAGALSRLPIRFRSPIVATVLVLAAWADAQWYFNPRYWKDDSRALVSWLAERLPEGSTVAAAPRYVTGVLSYYARLQQAPINFVAADSLAAISAPAVLLLTRLHHVPEEALLRARFRRLAGPHLREDSVGGYQVVSKAEKAEPSGE
jgi:uncharacterized membrane protein